MSADDTIHDEDLADDLARIARRKARRGKKDDDLHELEDDSVIDLEDFYAGPAHKEVKIQVGQIIAQLIRSVSLTGHVDQRALRGVTDLETLIRATISGADDGPAQLGAVAASAQDIVTGAEDLARKLGFNTWTDFQSGFGSLLVRIVDQNPTQNPRALRQHAESMAAANDGEPTRLLHDGRQASEQHLNMVERDLVASENARNTAESNLTALRGQVNTLVTALNTAATTRARVKETVEGLTAADRTALGLR